MSYSAQFLALQEKIINKREEEEAKKKRKEEEEKAKTKKEIEEFFEENKSNIIDKAIKSFMEEMQNGNQPPYNVECKIPTSLYFGCSRNQYNEMLENMVKVELERIIAKYKEMSVYATIVEEYKEGYNSSNILVRNLKNKVMKIQISLLF